MALMSVLAYARPIKVACVGNSITYGYLLVDRETEAYPARLQQLLGSGYEVMNFGRSSATLLRNGHFPYVTQPEYEQALAYKPDVVVIHLGVNDTDPRNWPNYNDRFVADYVELIEAFRQSNPRVRVIIARVTPLGVSHHRFKSGTRDWRDAVQDAIGRVARATGVEVIDFGTPLLDRQNLMPDAVHPDAEGAMILARTAYGGITGDYGGLSLPEVYSDGMVLQRNRPITIHGRADAGADITVTIGGNVATTTSDNQGCWEATLPAMTEGEGHTLVVSDGRTEKRIVDVAVGEVWLASGQSNMEFQLRHSVGAEEESGHPKLRIYDMKPIAVTDRNMWPDDILHEVNELRYFKPSRWCRADSSSIRNFSAIAYHFGKILADSLDVPVGVICNAVGGSGIESWIDIETLEHHYPEVLLNWRKNDYVQPWVQQRAAENSGTSPRQRHPYEPSYLFASGLRPLAHFPLAGVIWYQGESNAHNIEVHEAMFPLLLDSWRSYFGNSRLPFYFAQLSSLNRPSWPEFRDSQRRMACRYEDVEMAVTHDYGDSLDVHPRNKRPVADRLARHALNHLYGFGNVVSGGPTPVRAIRVGNAMLIEMDGCSGALSTSDGASPRTFEIAEIDGIYQPAEAQIDGNKIILKNMKVDKPSYVRYAWQPFTRANLVNADGIPASTFKLAVDADSVSDDSGIECGVSAAFAGTVDGRVVMAGGCNFPENPLGSDSHKHFYDGIYEIVPLADGGATQLRRIGSLSQPTAYGASAVTPAGLVMVGGTSGNVLLADAYLLAGAEGSLNPLPSLPFAMDNMAACAVGNVVYVAGGNVDGAPSNVLLRLDLDNLSKGWVRLRDFPGNPRIQPVLAASGPNLYMWGGFAGKGVGREASLELDGLRYDLKSGKWHSIDGPLSADGQAVSVGGGIATTLPDGRIVVAGGVNKDVFLSALRNQPADYLSHPIEWYRFNRDLLVYDPADCRWSVADTDAEYARAGAAMASDGAKIYLIGGELKPRIRTPKVKMITL